MTLHYPDISRTQRSIHEAAKARRARLFTVKPAPQPAPIEPVVVVEPPIEPTPVVTICRLTTHQRIHVIQHTVAKKYGITNSDMIGPSRKLPIVEPRQIAIYLCRQMTNRSTPAIGRKFGGRDHTTILSSVKKIERMMLRDSFFAQEITELTDRIEQCFAEPTV